LVDAIRTRKTSQIVAMALVEAFVMFFEVMFLYRELIDAITPWIAQQTGFQLGFFWTLALASFGWVGVRAMTWFLFGRFGTPALLGILARENIPGAQGAGATATSLEPEFWRGPIAALKAEADWFKKEAREVFELLSLPVLQLLAAGVNFAVVVLLGRPVFALPFRSLEQVLASTPQARPDRQHPCLERRHEPRSSDYCLLAVAAACSPAEQSNRPASSTLIIGIDVSGSFRDSRLRRCRGVRGALHLCTPERLGRLRVNRPCSSDRWAARDRASRSRSTRSTISRVARWTRSPWISAGGFHRPTRTPISMPTSSAWPASSRSAG
jgi:hypothetical protein